MTEFTPEEDAYYRKRLIADYDRLIEQLEGTMANGVARSFAAFFTAMEGKLMVAALKTAREMDSNTDEHREAADEIERLQELLRGTGANRYWEGRWRDAEAEIERLRVALHWTAQHCLDSICVRRAMDALEQKDVA